MLIQYKQHAYDLTTAPLMAELCCQTPPLNSGAGLTWLQKADIIIAPFQPHYTDIKTVLDWFHVINSTLQKKVMFVSNRSQKNK